MDRSLFGIDGTGNICVELYTGPVPGDESEESEPEPNSHTFDPPVDPYYPPVITEPEPHDPPAYVPA